MFDVLSFVAKYRMFEFHYQQMNPFEFVQCSKNDVRVHLMFDEMVFGSSLLIIKRLLFLKVVVHMKHL